MAGDIIPGEFDLVNIPPYFFDITEAGQDFIGFFLKFFDSYERHAKGVNPVEKLKIKKIKGIGNSIEKFFNILEFLMRTYQASDFVLNSDLIVSVKSQLADQDRANSNVKVFDGIGHTMIRSVLKSTDVGNQVNTLLHTPKTSNKFKPIPGYSSRVLGSLPSSRPGARVLSEPDGKKRTILDDLTGTITIDNSLIEVNSPLSNEEINSPNGQIQLSFKLQKVNQLSSYSIFYADRHLLFSSTTIQNSASKTHTLDEFPVGTGTIAIFAFYDIDGKVVQSHKKIGIKLLPQKNIESLIISPEYNYVEPDKSLRLTSLALKGGRTYDVDMSEINITIDNENIVTYDASSKQFKALKIGTTFVTFDFASKKDTVWFSVDDDVARALRWRNQVHKLSAGWNLISFYLNPDDPKTPQLLESIKDKILQVKDESKSYNPSVPSFLNTLSSIENGKGYWIKLSQAAELYTEGDILESEKLEIPLKKGWNLIAFPKEEAEKTSEALNSIAGKVLEVKNTSQSYNPTLPSFLNTLSELKPGEGYWIKVTENCTLKF